MPLRAQLQSLAAALEASGEQRLSLRVREVAKGSDPEVREFLVSNELWGGAGSIADQAGGDSRTAERKQIETALVILGEEQLEAGVQNSRTEMWVGAFKSWSRSGV